MPYKGVGVIKNASIDAAVGLEVEAGAAIVRVYTTSRQPGSRVALTAKGQELLGEVFDGDPATSFEFSAALPSGVEETDLTVAVYAAGGRVLVSYSPTNCDEDIPEPAQAIGAPASLGSAEACYLAGKHLEQYRHATRQPEDYYREGLRRDPGDIRCNVSLGRALYRQGRYTESEAHFRTAVARATQHNPNPESGEAYLGLGFALVALDEYQEAENAFRKAAWNAACQDQVFFELARIALRKGDWSDGETWLTHCLLRNAQHHQAIHLQLCAC